MPKRLFATFAVTISLAALSLAWLLPAEVNAQSPGARAKQTRAQSQTVRRQPSARQRSATVGSNGLCQRDTGTPTSQLNFRNRCDTEEFWRRIMELGSGAGDD